MPVQWNNRAMEAAKDKMALAILQAAIFVQTSLKVQLSKSYPPASRPGQFPRGRTWGGRDAVSYDPTSPAEVKQSMTVRLGYQKNAFYMGLLEVFQGRLGLREIVKRVKPQLERIIGAKVSNG